jgi:fibronectin type 3 domain-containing protein
MLIVSMTAGAYMNHPDNKTGAPGEETCRQCHNDYGLNTGSGNVMVQGIEDRYEPGRSYILTVSVYYPDMGRYCFEMTAVSEDSSQSSGSFNCIDTTETCLAGGGKYIKSTKNGLMGASNGMKTWQVQWNSPSKAEYDITFYCVGMASDCDNDEDGDYVYTCKMTVCPAPKTPGKPSGLLVEPGDQRVALAWYMMDTPDPAGGPVSYNIYWSDSSSGSLSLLTTVTEKSYVHTGLVNGRTYRYQISGSNDEGEGPLSDVATVSPNLVPDRPRHLTTTQVSAEGVHLQWDAPSTWGSAGGHVYNVYRGECPCSTVLVRSGLETATYTDTESLLPNVTYHYRIQAKNDLGVGGIAEISLHVPPAPPGLPLDLSHLVNKGVVELTWEPPVDEGGDAVRYFRVYRAEEGKEPVLVQDMLRDTTFQDNSVDPDMTYEYTVAAVNVAGEGTLSTPISAYIAPLPTSGETGNVIYEDVPFSGLVAVGAVIIIGAVMVGRLSHASNEAERRRQD